MKDVGEVRVASRGKVLVMDDEEVILELTKEFLTGSGYEVEVAGDGPEAIVLYKLARESGEPFDAVVMDLCVPGGRGGREAIRELQQIDPDVRAIAMSGNPNDPFMEEFREHGFRGVIVKPYSSAMLIETIRNVIEGAGS